MTCMAWFTNLHQQFGNPHMQMKIHQTVHLNLSWQKVFWFTESDSTRSSSRRRMNIFDRKDGVGLRLVWEPIEPLN